MQAVPRPRNQTQAPARRTDEMRYQTMYRRQTAHQTSQRGANMPARSIWGAVENLRSTRGRLSSGEADAGTVESVGGGSAWR
jgi:hypothetical protein